MNYKMCSSQYQISRSEMANLNLHQAPEKPGIIIADSRLYDGLLFLQNKLKVLLFISFCFCLLLVLLVFTFSSYKINMITIKILFCLDSCFLGKIFQFQFIFIFKFINFHQS